MKQHFTDTIFYQIELTARYCKMLGQQVFEKYDTGISVEEYTALDVIMVNRNLCQRDLANIILKDRANTGKLLDSLEKKELITRELAIKNNRPVKLVDITELGIETLEQAEEKVRPHYKQVKEKIQNSNISNVGELLKELREVLNNTVDIQI